MEREEKHRGKLITIIKSDGTLEPSYLHYHDVEGEITIYRSRTFQYAKMFIMFFADDQRLSFKTTPGILSHEGRLYTLVTASHIYVFEADD